MSIAEYHQDVPTADGQLPCFICHPDTSGASSDFAPVIVYMDVPGIREELRDFARRIAAEGFLCVLPDLYYREGTLRFDLNRADKAEAEAEFKRMFAAGSRLTNQMVMVDTEGILTYLAELDIARDLTGTIGYCMSGQFVLSAAGTFPSRIRATASLYGTRMVTDKADSPHKLVNHIQGELYLGFAEQDHYVEDFVIPELTSALDANNIDYELVIHPGTDHGFCFPQRPAYNQAEAERVWASVFDLFKRQLG